MDTISIAALSAIVSIIVAIATTIRENKKESIIGAETTASVKQELIYISKGVEDIKYNLRETNKNYTEMNERLVRVETDVENIKTKLNGGEK